MAQVKQVLEELIAGGRLPLDARFLAPCSPGEPYGRRLLHKGPRERYTVVVMGWGAGQGTPLHDHAGKWCVECLYQGKIRVRSFELEGGSAAGRFRFRPARVVYAGCGEAGALIPPFEHHMIDNPFPEPAATVHVYAGEMTWCHVFEDAGDGSFVCVRKTLEYTTD